MLEKQIINFPKTLKNLTDFLIIMKLLLSADIHGRKRSVDLLKEKVKSENIDLIICAGDMTVFERELEIILEDLNSIGLPIIIIPGNHESPEILKEISLKFDNLIYLHKATFEFNDYLFVGYGNPGFALIEPEFEQFAANIKKVLKGKKIVLVTHGPPHNTKLDYLEGNHVGCKSITKFIKEHDNILVAISGHLHENFGLKDKINKTKLINPGPNGEIIEI